MTPRFIPPAQTIPKNVHLTSVWSLDLSQSLPWALGLRPCASSYGYPDRVSQIWTWSCVGSGHQTCLHQIFLSPPLVARTGQGQLCHLGGVPRARTCQHGTQSVSSLLGAQWPSTFPSHVSHFHLTPGGYQVPQGILGLLLTLAPGEAPGDRMAPTGRCNVSVPESGENGLPKIVPKLGFCMTQVRHRTSSGLWSIEVLPPLALSGPWGPCIDSHLWVSDHSAAYSPQHSSTAWVTTGVLYPLWPSPDTATP